MEQEGKSKGPNQYMCAQNDSASSPFALMLIAQIFLSHIFETRARELLIPLNDEERKTAEKRLHSISPHDKFRVEFILLSFRVEFIPLFPIYDSFIRTGSSGLTFYEE